MYAWCEADPGPPPSSDAERRLRQSFGGFTTGVCLVTTVGPDGKREGMTINSFSSVSLAPPLVLWSVRDAARSADVFTTANAFSLSILAASQAELALHFARPAPDKFVEHEDAFEISPLGCPRLRFSVATFDCRVYSRHQEGDHTLLIGRVESLQQQADAPPLIFHGGKMGSMWELAALFPPLGPSS